MTLTPQQMMMMQQQQQALNTGPSDSQILAGILQQGRGAAPTSGIGGGLASAGESIAKALMVKRGRKEREAKDAELMAQIQAMSQGTS